MATDWAKDVKKYAANADDGVIAGIVRYCGIALRNRDSSLVSFSDPTELARVRNNFLKKKLGLTQADDVLDAAIAKVGETMKADRTKNRVTVYYLLAETHGKLDLFVKKTAEKAAAKTPAAKAEKPAAKAGSKSKVAGAAAAAAVAGAAAAAPKAKKAPAKKVAAADSSASAKTASAPKAVSAKVAGAAAAAAGGAAMLAGNLGDKAADAASSAKDVAADAVDAVKDGAAKAGAAVASAAGAASDAAGAVVSGAADVAGKAVGAAGDAAGAAADAVGAGAAAVAGAAGAAVAGVAGLASGATDKLGALTSAANDDDDSGLGWLWWLLLAALLAFALWWLFFRGPGDDHGAAPAADASVAAEGAAANGGAVDLAAAPAEGTVTIPTGAGVTSETRDGKPVVKVYFDTGKTDIVPAFAATAGGLKAWLDSHAGSSLAISGYNDASGNAKANAELSKNRAKAVQTALVGSGIAETSAVLVKPENTTDTTVAKDAARRVEVTVK